MGKKGWHFETIMSSFSNVKDKITCPFRFKLSVRMNIGQKISEHAISTLSSSLMNSLVQIESDRELTALGNPTGLVLFSTIIASRSLYVMWFYANYVHSLVLNCCFFVTSFLFPWDDIWPRYEWPAMPICRCASWRNTEHQQCCKSKLNLGSKYKIVNIIYYFLPSFAHDLRT